MPTAGSSTAGDEATGERLDELLAHPFQTVRCTGKSMNWRQNLPQGPEPCRHIAKYQKDVNGRTHRLIPNRTTPPPPLGAWGRDKWPL